MTSVILSANNQVFNGVRFKLGPTGGGITETVSPTYFETSTIGNNTSNFGYTVNTRGIEGLTLSIYNTTGTNQAIEWIGYFTSEITENITITVTNTGGSVSEPTISKLWIGDNALAQTNANSVISFTNDGSEGAGVGNYTFNAQTGIYYPFRLQYFRNGSTPDNRDINFSYTISGRESFNLTNSFYFINNGVLRF